MNLRSGQTTVTKERWEELLAGCRENNVFWAAVTTVDEFGGSTGDALAYACLCLVRDNERLLNEALRLARCQTVVYGPITPGMLDIANAQVKP